MSQARIGIDLGGTKVEALLLGPTGEIGPRLRAATPRDDYAATVELLCTLVDDLDRRMGERCSVGIGTPGAWRSDLGVMHNCNSTWLNGRPLLTDLVLRLGNRVRMANDANCLSLSEAFDGAAAGARCVFGVILGTGVGGGIVIDGALHLGRNAIAGEWGHTPMPYLGVRYKMSDELGALEAKLSQRACYCGRSNCIETFLSGPGLALTHEALWGDRLDAVAIGRLSSAATRATLELYWHMLARGLAQIVNVLDPDVIVVGGGVSELEGLYARVPYLWHPYVFSDIVTTPLVPARHGATSGVRGAARLW
jgi:predicted NBD/HSP70 family sugar kinase